MKIDFERILHTALICATVGFCATQLKSCGEAYENRPRIVYDCEDKP